MNRIKKILLLGITVLLAFSFSACSFEDGKVNDNADKTKATDRHEEQNETPPAAPTADRGETDATGGAEATDGNLPGDGTPGQEDDGGRLPGIVDDAKDDIEDDLDKARDDIKEGITDAKDQITDAGNQGNRAGGGSMSGASGGQ